MTNVRSNRAPPPSESTPGYCLRRHAVERVLERSDRAPSWLLDALERKQFAHLHVGTNSLKRYVLVFDSLANNYIVAVVAPDNFRVITVLTATQYQATHGVIPDVFFKLSQMARAQVAVQVPVGQPEAPVEPVAPAPCWRANWKVRFTMFYAGRKRRKYSAPLGTGWRQDQVLRHAALSLDAEAAQAYFQGLDFDTSAALLAKTPEFLEWVVFDLRIRGKRLDHLLSVSITSNHFQNAEVDVTAVLFSQLAA